MMTELNGIERMHSGLSLAHVQLTVNKTELTVHNNQEVFHSIFMGQYKNTVQIM